MVLVNENWYWLANRAMHGPVSLRAGGRRRSRAAAPAAIG